MAITLIKITPAQHESALEWIMDAFPRQTEEASTLTAQQAYRVIQRHYGGGWEGFISDLRPVAPCVWCATPTQRWDWGNPDCGCF